MVESAVRKKRPRELGVRRAMHRTFRIVVDTN
jgi:hypothetical protein